MLRRLRAPLLVGAFAQLILTAQAQTAAPAADSTAAEGETVQLSPFQVSAANDQGYGSSNTVGATRVDTPIKDTPLSVVVANRQFIEDLGATQSYQALRFVAGVSGAGAPYSGQMTLRGQNLSGTTFRDGVPDLASIGGAEMIDLAFTDRVEAIEGPAGTLYGISSSGGVINTVSKVPLDHDYNSVKVEIGSYNVHRGELDSTGRLDNSRHWTYRAIFADQTGNTNMGGPDNAIAAALMLRYAFSDGKGAALFRVTYQDITRGTNEYPWFDDRFGQVSFFLPRTNPITEKDAYREHKTIRADVDINRAFRTGSIDWTARVAARYSYLNNVISRLYEQADSFYQFFDANGVALGNHLQVAFTDPRIADIQVTTRTRSSTRGHQETGITNVDVNGKWQMGPISNSLLVYAFEQSLLEFDYATSGNYPGIDLYHPVYYSAPDAVASPTVQSINTLLFNVGQAAAFQDNASIFHDKVIFVFGARYDRKTSTSINRISNVKVYSDVRAGTSHKLGLVTKPIEPVSLYYDYSETFNPSTFNQFTGAKYPNLLSENNEIGLKLGLFKNQLVLNTAFFNTKTSNVIISLGNIIGAGGLLMGVSGPGGTLKTDGWESDGTWSIGKNLAVIGGVGSLNSKTATGAYARAVPLGLNYKAFAKYTFTDNALAGFFVGYGYEHNAHRNGDGTIGGFIMPGYNDSNALVGYGTHNWQIQVNVENLTDATYATIAVAGSIVYAGAPRNWQVTASYHW